MFDSTLFGFGFCRTWITLCMAYPASQWLLDGKFSQSQLYMIASFSASFIIALLASRKALSGSRAHIAKARGALFATAVLSCLISVALLVFALAIQESVVSSGYFAVAGLGGGVLQILWGERFSKLEPKRAATNAAPAMGAAALLSLLAAFCTEAGTVALFALLPIASLWLLWENYRTGAEATLSASSPLQAIHKPPIKKSKLFLSVFIIYFVYAFLGYFSLGLFAGADGFPMSRPLGNLLASCLFLLLVVMKKWRSLVLLYRFALPLMTVAMASIYLLPANLIGISGLAFSLGYKVFDIFFWLILAALSFRHANAFRLFGVGLGLMTVSSFCGMEFSAFLTSHPPTSDQLTAISLALVFFLLLVTALLLPEKDLFSVVLPENDQPESGTPSMNDEFDCRCSAIAQQFSLTPREEDVLRLLLRGRSTEVIAREMTISRGTAHTHITHIYQKTGFHKRQELIDYFLGDDQM